MIDDDAAGPNKRAPEPREPAASVAPPPRVSARDWPLAWPANDNDYCSLGRAFRGPRGLHASRSPPAARRPDLESAEFHSSAALKASGQFSIRLSAKQPLAASPNFDRELCRPMRRATRRSLAAAAAENSNNNNNIDDNGSRAAARE